MIEIVETDTRPIIFIIEDDEDQTKILKLQLDKLYNVFAFDNLTKLTKDFFRNKANLIILDLNLDSSEKLMGEEAGEILKKFDKDIKFIIISGESEERIEKAKNRINPVAIFRKPLDYQALLEKIKKVIIWKNILLLMDAFQDWIGLV